MREIKFRAKHLPLSNEPAFPAWIYGGGVIQFPDSLKWAMLGVDDNGRAVVTIVKPESIGQFTGLLDSNNVQIFEGDILEMSKGNTFIVDFDNWENGGQYEDWEGGYGWYLESLQRPGQGDTALIDTERWYEVIGNIYENPELLK